MFFYVYILRGKKDGRLYIGYTNDLRRRMKEHNSGENPSTKHRRPLELIYYETYKSQKDAKTQRRNAQMKWTRPGRVET